MSTNIGLGIARRLVDVDGDPLDDGDGRLKVDVASLSLGNVAVDLVYTDDTVQIYGSDTTSAIKTDSNGRLSVDVNSGTLTVNTVDVSSLSTNAKQDTIIGHLDGVEGVLIAIVSTNVAIRTAVEAIQSGQLSDGHNVVVTSAPTTAVTIAANVNVDHIINTVGHGVKTVTTAGTDVALAGSTSCRKVDIQAQTDNTGLIAVGASGVDATEATGTGIILNAGDSYSVEIDDLADISIDSTVNGEGVRYTYWYKTGGV